MVCVQVKMGSTGGNRGFESHRGKRACREAPTVSHRFCDIFCAGQNGVNLIVSFCADNEWGQQEEIVGSNLTGESAPAGRCR